MNDPLLRTEEAAAILQVATGTLTAWRSTGRYQLSYIKVGRNVRYRRSVLDAFMESRTKSQT